MLLCLYFWMCPLGILFLMPPWLPLPRMNLTSWQGLILWDGFSKGQMDHFLAFSKRATQEGKQEIQLLSWAIHGLCSILAEDHGFSLRFISLISKWSELAFSLRPWESEVGLPKSLSVVIWWVKNGLFFSRRLGSPVFSSTGLCFVKIGIRGRRRIPVLHILSC